MTASRFLALAEETTYASSGWPYIYFKILNESINSVRNDYFPETTEFWTPDVKVEGHWGGGGDAVIPVDPIQWPKLLVFFIGDGSSSVVSDSAYTHTFKFGANETVSATGIKAATILKGVGIEKDRRFEGGVIESIGLECVAREPVTSTITFFHSGDESLTTAASPSYASYTQPFFSFASTATMTIGGSHDALTTAPTIENFRVTLTRGYDKEHLILGSKKVAAATLSGFASVTGSMDLSFTSEDEHERFLTAVDGTAMGDQASFEIDINLQGALIGSTSKYAIGLTIPEAYYTGSEANVSGRDRIVQTVNFRGNYNASDVCAAFFTVVNATDAYSTLT